jgi:hypothetical protein
MSKADVKAACTSCILLLLGDNVCNLTHHCNIYNITTPSPPTYEFTKQSFADERMLNSHSTTLMNPMRMTEGIA